MKKLTLLAIVSLMALSACNTISGAGRDVSALGGAVSSGAENVQQKNEPLIICDANVVMSRLRGAFYCAGLKAVCTFNILKYKEV